MVNGAESNEEYCQFINANLKCNSITKLKGLVKCYSNVEIYGEKISYLYYKYLPKETLKSIPHDLKHFLTTTSKNQNLIKLSSKSSFVRNTIKNKYSDSNCSLVIDLHNHIFNENNCYYFQTIFNESNMSNRRKSILSNKGNICDCTNLTLDNGRNTKNRDVYRSILGPTPDESILAGLQTVIDMCGILENTTQAIQRMDETYSESRRISYDSQLEHYNITPPEPPYDNDFENACSSTSIRRPSGHSSEKRPSTEGSICSRKLSDEILREASGITQTASIQKSIERLQSPRHSRASYLENISTHTNPSICSYSGKKRSSCESPSTRSQRSIPEMGTQSPSSKERLRSSRHSCDSNLENLSARVNRSISSSHSGKKRSSYQSSPRDTLESNLENLTMKTSPSICSHSGKKRSSCQSCQNRLRRASNEKDGSYFSQKISSPSISKNHSSHYRTSKSHTQQHPSIHSRERYSYTERNGTCRGECCKCHRTRRYSDNQQQTIRRSSRSSQSPRESFEEKSQSHKGYRTSSSRKQSIPSTSRKSDQINNDSIASMKATGSSYKKLKSERSLKDCPSRQRSELIERESIKSKSSKRSKADSIAARLSEASKILQNSVKSLTSKRKSNMEGGNSTHSDHINSENATIASEYFDAESINREKSESVSPRISQHSSRIQKNIQEQPTTSRSHSKLSNCEVKPSVEHHNITPLDPPETIEEEPDNVQQVSDNNKIVSYSTVEGINPMDLNDGLSIKSYQEESIDEGRSVTSASLENIPTSTTQTVSSCESTEFTTSDENADESNCMGQGDVHPVCQLTQRGIRYACAKITEYDDYTTYEILNVPVRPPKKCACVKGVFVVKKKS